MVPASVPGTPFGAGAAQNRRRTIAIVIGAIVVVLACAWFARAPLLRTALRVAVALAAGYDVRTHELSLGSGRLELRGLHVTRRGDPVFDAAAVDIDYSLRDLLPGSRHRYGLLSLDVTRPHLYVVRRADGTFNLSGSGRKTPARIAGNAPPLSFTAHVRDGVVELIDPRNLDPGARDVKITGVRADAAIDSTRISRYRVDASVEQDGRGYPIHGKAIVDARRGYAINRLQAAQIPLRSLGNFLIHSHIAVIRGGDLRDIDVRYYALDLPPGRPATYHLAGGASVTNVSMKLDVLTQMVHDLNGRLAFDDNAIVSPRLGGDIGTTPLIGSGGMYDFSDPQFRLAIVAKEDLRVLHRDFNFLKREPLSGPLAATCLLEGPISQPLILSSARASHVAYGTIGVRDFRATIAYHEGVVFAGDVAGTVGRIRARVAGRFLTGGPDVDSLMALTADAPAGSMPYLDRIAPHAVTQLTLAGSGTGLLLDTHGIFTAAGGGERVATLFALDPHGVGELGPFSLRQPHGSIDGAFMLDREHGTSALWASAKNLAIAEGNPDAILHGVNLPAFPPMEGNFDGNFAAVDVDRKLILFGTGATRNGVFAGVPIARARADFAGPVDRMALRDVHARGEFGDFSGNGALFDGGFAFAGRLDGTLQGMRRWTGDLGARGALHGPIALVSRGGSTLVQTSGMAMRDASVHGVGLNALTGTFAIDPTKIVVYGATAQIAGGRVVARGDSARGIRLSTAGIDATRLRAAGFPAQRGTLVGAGDMRLDGRSPAFDGSLAFDGGRVADRRIDASALIGFAGGNLRIADASAAVSRAFGFLDGSIEGLTATPRYDLHAKLAYADLQMLGGAIPLPVPFLRGTIAADVRVNGSGRRPDIDGTLRIPEGSVNGMNFGDVRTHVSLDSSGVRASGSARVGSTVATFSGAEMRGNAAFSVDAPRADLSDFNDFFPAAETLSGIGSARATIVRRDGATFSSGNVDLEQLRYRQFRFGHAVATWSGLPGRVEGNLSITGPGGSLQAGGTALIPRGTRLRKLATTAAMNLTATLHGVDLGLWLPAFGYLPPVIGHVDAQTTIRGRYPGLALDFDGALSGGMIGRVPIDTFHVSAATEGLRTQIRSLDVAIAGVDLRGAGSFGLRPSDPITIDLDATSDRLGDFVQTFAGKRFGLGGAGNVHVAVRGTPAAPNADASFLFRPLSIWNLAIPSFIGNISVDPQRIALKDATIALPEGTITLAGSAPLAPGPSGLPDSTPLSFDLGLRGVALDQFAVLAPPQTHLGGDVEGDVHVRGTIAQPRIVGELDLRDGSYTGPLETQPITGAQASLAFKETAVNLARFEATIGGGRLDGSGSLNLPEPDDPSRQGRPSYDAEFRLDAVRVAFPGYGSTRADGTVWLRRSAPAPGVVGGSLTVSDASIPLAAFLKAGAPSAAPQFALAGVNPLPGPSIAGAAFGLPSWLLDLGLDVHLTAGNNVRIRSPILDIGGRGSVQIAGQVGAPALEGELDATPGGSLFLNRAFKLQEASVRFTPQNGLAPDLYARATTQIAPASGLEPIDVTVSAQGTIPDIKLSYASNPPYDEATIVGLLFGANSLGASVGQLNSFAPSTNILLPPNAFQQTPSGTFALSQEAASLINAQFTARLLAPIEQGLGSAFGLSDLAINVAPTGSVGVQARRVLGRNTSALYGSSLTYPYRMTFGLESRPDANTSVIFTAFTQQGLYSFGAVKPDAYLSANPLLGSAADLGGTQGITVNFQRRFR